MNSVFYQLISDPALGTLYKAIRLDRTCSQLAGANRSTAVRFHEPLTNENTLFGMTSSFANAIKSGKDFGFHDIGYFLRMSKLLNKTISGDAVIDQANVLAATNPYEVDHFKFGRVRYEDHGSHYRAVANHMYPLSLLEKVQLETNSQVVKRILSMELAKKYIFKPESAYSGNGLLVFSRVHGGFELVFMDPSISELNVSSSRAIHDYCSENLSERSLVGSGAKKYFLELNDSTETHLLKLLKLSMLKQLEKDMWLDENTQSYSAHTGILEEFNDLVTVDSKAVEGRYAYFISDVRGFELWRVPHFEDGQEYRCEPFLKQGYSEFFVNNGKKLAEADEMHIPVLKQFGLEDKGYDFDEFMVGLIKSQAKVIYDRCKILGLAGKAGIGGIIDIAWDKHQSVYAPCPSGLGANYFPKPWLMEMSIVPAELVDV